MPIEPNTQLLHYTLTEKIGEGGMGAVWRATDTTLNRDVAIKILPQLFVEDPDRLDRFDREAKLLASLNHPNIAAIYGFHEDKGSRFLAMELVEGEDLHKRLQRGPLSVEEALKVALQIATGIEAAHDRGVIHRDLKPANVIVSADGVVKLLDFGLAKAMDNDPAGSDPSLSPTMTSAGTVAGMILGTAAYMSPEQARGKTLDRRTDLWSFGCVLYECLVGRSLFAGETISDSLAAILRKDPNWSNLPDETPPMIRLLLRRCLARDPNKRIKDAGDARIELEQAIDDPTLEALGFAAGDATPIAPQSPAQRRLPWALAIVAMLAAGYFALQYDAPAPQRESQRLTIPVPGNNRLINAQAASPCISPDGRFLVFGVNDGARTSLWIRPFDSFEAHALPGTIGAAHPFWSPDSRELGFFVGGQLKRIDIATERVQLITGAKYRAARGASWNADDKILYVPNSNSGILLIDLNGGAPRQLTTPNPDVVDSSHRWPFFLPDGEHYVFLAWTNDLTARSEHAGIYLASISGEAEPVRILADTSSVVYVDPGYLLVMREENLVAVPFDAKAGKVTGEGMVIAGGVLRERDAGFGAFTAADNGTLVYASGQSLVNSELNWYDRSGNVTPALDEPASFQGLRLSPDGTRIAADLVGPSGDGEVWIFDLERGVRTILASGATGFSGARWSGAGDRILMTSFERGYNDIISVAVDGSGQQQVLLGDDLDQVGWDWSRDGKQLLYWPIDDSVGTIDVWLYSVETKESRLLVGGAAIYAGARFSADARYFVYSSNESGEFEVFAQAIEGGARTQVSTAAGGSAHWSDDGSEIVYTDPEGRVMAVAVEPGASLKLSRPVELFSIADRIVAGDITGDHERLLLATRTDEEMEPLHVILNWHAGQ